MLASCQGKASSSYKDQASHTLHRREAAASIPWGQAQRQGVASWALDQRGSRVQEGTLGSSSWVEDA